MSDTIRATIPRAVAAVLSVVLLTVLGATGDRATAADSGDLTVVQLRNNFYMVAGDGGNVGVQVGDDGVVLVNAGMAERTSALLAAVKKITSQPIRYIIDTSADEDMVGGNAALAAAGKTLFLPPLGPGASILSSAQVLAQMAAKGLPPGDWPTEAYLDATAGSQPPGTTININGEPIFVMHELAAHSAGDSFVLFRRSDVVMSGDVMDITRFPVIDLAHGGSIQGEINALNNLLQLVPPPAPLIYEYSGTYVIPGHGRVCDQWEVVNYRDMIVIVRDLVANMIKRHMTLSQIEAAHPALAFEARYGSNSGSWTTNMFIEAVYKSLTAKK